MEELFFFPESQENNNANENFYVVNGSKCDLLNQETPCSRIRNDWSIVLVKSGIISFNDKRKTISKGEIFIFPPNEKQDFTYSKNASFVWLFLNGKEVPSIIEKFSIPILKSCIVRQDNLLLMLDNIANEYLSKSVGYEEIASLYAKMFLCSIKRELNVHGAKSKDHLKNIVFSMYSNPHISNTECAEICFMSRENFIRAFKAQYGMTPHKFKQNIIITRAKELLTKTNLTITAISETLGFSDNPLYFNNYFKNVVGMYPLKFRTTNQTENLKKTPQKRQKSLKKANNFDIQLAQKAPDLNR